MIAKRWQKKGRNGEDLTTWMSGAGREAGSYKHCTNFTRVDSRCVWNRDYSILISKKLPPNINASLVSIYLRCQPFAPSLLHIHLASTYFHHSFCFYILFTINTNWRIKRGRPGNRISYTVEFLIIQTTRNGKKKKRKFSTIWQMTPVCKWKEESLLPI